jgi:hypothetical protein
VNFEEIVIDLSFLLAIVCSRYHQRVHCFDIERFITWAFIPLLNETAYILRINVYRVVFQMEMDEGLSSLLETNFSTNYSSSEMSRRTFTLVEFLLSTAIPIMFEGNASSPTEIDDSVIHYANPEEMLNPAKRNPSFYHIIITHAVTFVVGILGNLVAVFVLIGDRKSRNATNLFLVRQVILYLHLSMHSDYIFYRQEM